MKKKQKAKVTVDKLGNVRLEKKKSYPKGMTIRYTEEEEKEIILMMERMGEKTMSKAFLKAPNVMAEQHKKVQWLEETITKQAEKINELESMAASFQEFNRKLEAFIKKR
jgi:spore coat protein CotH